jgi:signal transduction histidine kinase
LSPPPRIPARAAAWTTAWAGSLHAKLFLAAALSTALLTVVVAVSGVRGFRGSIESYTKGLAAGTARGMADYVERLDPGLKFRREMSELLAAWASPESISQIDIFKPAFADGAAFADVWATSRARPEEVAVDDSEMLGRMGAPAEDADLVDLGGGRMAWRVHVPLGRDGSGGAVGVLRVHCGLDRWNAVWGHYLTFALKMLLVVVPLEFALLWAITSACLRRPMLKLLSAMQSLGGGDASARANIARRDELGQIARRFDAMAGELQGAGAERDALLEEVRGFNAALRGRIDDALAELRAKNEELGLMAGRMSILREELAQQERLAVAGQMTAAFAHEIGTPLNLVDGHLQLLLGEPAADGAMGVAMGVAIRERLATIRAQIGRVGDTVKRLMSHTRQVEPKKEPVEMAPLLAELGHLWAPALGARGIAFNPDVPLGCTIMADRRQMEQLLTNLVANAADAMEGGGSITIACARAGRGGQGTVGGGLVTGPGTGLGTGLGGGEWEISVSDTGHGIPAGDLARVFRPMFTTKPEGRGTGLGLAICRAIARAHGGEMGIESEAGRGTTVRLTLPGGGA